MGRYYDDKVSTAGLDPANPFFGPIKQSALAINKAETNWYNQRSEMFEELNGGSKPASSAQVEAAYANLHSGLSVYDFKAVFNSVNPSKKSGLGYSRYVYVPWTLTQFDSGFATDVYVMGAEDDDGDSLPEQVNDVLAYVVGAGKVQIDTLYTNLQAFTSGATKSGYFTLDSDDDDDFQIPVTVYKGFGEVPHRWNAKSGYSSQKLQVMNAAGTSYNAFVGPKINAHNQNLSSYEASGGGPLVSDFYAGTPDFPYQGFQGSDVSYNKPQNLPTALIKEARGFTS